uniref:Uncharacterized protein n=1 Tax=Candidatus Kentrum sp. DK TaxID=2126562 RepID=A0A450TJY5_9GAMM|nr:MAG: hypothetical protein BECKDK2373C_GA0170839_11721 [Candidatus Kentron sp. DK]
MHILFDLLKENIFYVILIFSALAAFTIIFFRKGLGGANEGRQAIIAIAFGVVYLFLPFLYKGIGRENDTVELVVGILALFLPLFILFFIDFYEVKSNLNAFLRNKEEDDFDILFNRLMENRGRIF